MTSFPGHMHGGPAPYHDHILTVTDQSCPDPYVLWDQGNYYMVRFPIGPCFMSEEVIGDLGEKERTRTKSSWRGGVQEDIWAAG